MNKIRTATITWISYKNFGTYLQAYALQKSIQKLGFDNSIISDADIVKKIEHPNIIKYYYYKIKQLVYNKEKGNNKSSLAFDNFSNKYLTINKGWRDYNELNKKYDCFLCGSDQIWSPNFPFSSFYYLGFTNKKKIAYAPSLGVSYYPKEKIELVKPFLRSFSYISVRESQGARILKNDFGIDSTVVLDPTLLLDKKEWELFIQKPLEEENYVLVYLLTYNEIYLNFIKEFASKKKLKVKIFIIDEREVCFADIPLYAGPQEFLNEIYHSSYFFTDSFHGSIFAIQFEKRFYTLQRFNPSLINNQNSRIINLFEKLKLSDYWFSENNLDKILTTPSVDYIKVKEILSIEQEQSIKFLKRTLI